MQAPRRLFRAALAATIAAVVWGSADSAQAFSPYLVVPDPAVAEASPAYRYANMTDAQAFAELDRRQILYTRLGEVSGVRAPIRLTGRLHGVWFHSSLPPEQRVTSMFEILDARLALALDDYAIVLARHDIDEVVHFTMYRPNVPRRAPHEEAEASSSARSKRPVARSTHSLDALNALDAFNALARARRFGLEGDAARALGARSRSAARARDAARPRRRAREARARPRRSAREAEGAPHGRAEACRDDLSDAPARSTPHRAAPSAHATPHAPIARPATPAHEPKPLTPSQKTTWAPPGTRHPAGLAIDVGLLHKKDGRWLNVAAQFHGHIGDKTCGRGAHVPEDPDARELRALVCEAADAGIFTYVLTPDYNVAHHDHFHMEIKPGVKWFLYH